MQPWYFLHIPKTAGTSTIRALSGWRTCPARDWAGLVGLSRWRWKWSDGFAGHFGLGLAEYVDRPLWTFTFLRDPVELVLSAHGHLLRDTSIPLHAEACGRTLVEFLRDFPVLHEPQSRWLAREVDGVRMKRCRTASEANALVEEAIGRTVDWMRRDPAGLLERVVERARALAFVGFVEDLDGGIGSVARVLGKPVRLGGPRLNVHSARRRIEDLSAEERDAVEAVTRLDRQLYRCLWEHWRHRATMAADGGKAC